MWLILLAAATLCLTAMAQTQAQLTACGNSLIMTSYPENDSYTFQTTDTSYFKATFTYSVSACTNHHIPINRLYLTDDYDSSIIRCSLSSFDVSGQFTSICNLAARSMTHRTMAILAQRDGHTDWSFTINMGVRPTLINVENIFSVVGQGPYPSDGTITRRSWKAALKRDFECPIGQAMCAVGYKGRWQCTDISSDVTSCGACPGAASLNDCTDIEGVNGVECRAGACHVTSCVRGWRVSGNHQQCVPNILRSTRTL